MPDILIYGAKWCADCEATIAWMEARSLSYDFRDLDENEADVADFRRLTSEAGITERLFPTVIIDGRLLSGPSIEELAAALASPAEN